MKKMILGLMLISVQLTFAQIQITDQLAIGGNENISFINAVVAPDGGFYVGFSTESSSFTGNLAVSIPGEEGIVITKYSQSLNLEWQKSFGGNQTDQLHDILDTGDGILLLAISNSEPSGNKTSPHYGETDAWVIKLDYNGDIIWQNTYGGDLYELGLTGEIVENNEIILATSTQSSSSGNLTTTNFGNFSYDYWVIKINSNGNIIWQQNYGGTDSEHISRISLNTDGNILIQGNSGSGISGNKSEQNIGNRDFWVVCIDTSGAILWDKTIGSTSSESFGQIIEFDGHYKAYINQSLIAFIGGMRDIPVKGQNDIWIVDLDLNGQVLAQTSVGGDQMDFMGRAFSLSDGKFFIPMTSNSDASFDKSEGPVGGSNTDLWLLLFSKEGDLIWEKTIGTEGFDSFNRGLVLNDKIILIGASEMGVSGDKTVTKISPGNTLDLWILALDTTFLSTNDNDFVLPSISLYPNPTSNVLNIKHVVSSLEKVEIFDTKGQKIYEVDSKSMLSQSNIEIDLSGLSTGVYTVKITGEHFVMDRKVVKE